MKRRGQRKRDATDERHGSPDGCESCDRNVKQKMKDQEYRNGLRAEARIMIKRDNPRLAQQLGLSEDEAERLFDLLADHQAARIAEGSALGGHFTQQERQEALRTQREFDRKEEESIQALLGDKYRSGRPISGSI